MDRLVKSFGPICFFVTMPFKYKRLKMSIVPSLLAEHLS